MESQLKNLDKMLLRLDRIQASHPRVARLYEMTVKAAFPATRGVYKIRAIETSPEHTDGLRKARNEFR
jgi:hypothetical protein